jgi:hypothetical protein
MKSYNHNIDYTLLHRHSPEHVEVQFSGIFLNQAVTWHAHIRTLRDDCLHVMFTPHQSQLTTRIQAQPFIDIKIQNNTHHLTVALNLPVIDDAAILRTIIMIRQYKRLQTGRHQYGDIATFSFDAN